MNNDPKEVVGWLGSGGNYTVQRRTGEERRAERQPVHGAWLRQDGNYDGKPVKNLRIKGSDRRQSKPESAPSAPKAPKAPELSFLRQIVEDTRFVNRTPVEQKVMDDLLAHAEALVALCNRSQPEVDWKSRYDELLALVNVFYPAALDGSHGHFKKDCPVCKALAQFKELPKAEAANRSEVLLAADQLAEKVMKRETSLKSSPYTLDLVDAAKTYQQMRPK